MFDYPSQTDEEYGTQGGGNVKWNGLYWEFTEPPDWSDYQVGDPMPEEWGIGGLIITADVKEKS